MSCLGFQSLPMLSQPASAKAWAPLATSAVAGSGVGGCRLRSPSWIPRVSLLALARPAGYLWARTAGIWRARSVAGLNRSQMDYGGGIPPR